MFQSKILLENHTHCHLKTHPLSVLNESKILDQLVTGKVVVLSTVHSTNQYIIDNLKYMQSGDVFVTDHQTHGKGKYGKSWITPNAQGIALSMYWKIKRTILIKSELSIMISYVVAKVLKKMGISEIKIKWPNDLYVYGRKLAGILIEIITTNKLNAHLIIGIGINISICICSELIMNFNKNWIDFKKIGIFVDHNILVINVIKELHLMMSKILYT